MMGFGGPMNVRDELRAPDPPFVMGLFSQAQNPATSKKNLLLFGTYPDDVTPSRDILKLGSCMSLSV